MLNLCSGSRPKLGLFLTHSPLREDFTYENPRNSILPFYLREMSISAFPFCCDEREYQDEAAERGGNMDEGRKPLSAPPLPFLAAFGGFHI